MKLTNTLFHMDQVISTDRGVWVFRSDLLAEAIYQFLFHRVWNFEDVSKRSGCIKGKLSTGLTVVSYFVVKGTPIYLYTRLDASGATSLPNLLLLTCSILYDRDH